MASDDIAAQTAQILFLTYGNDAGEMAALRCRELAQIGDRKGAESWERVLSEVKRLVAADTGSHGSVRRAQ